MNTPPIRRFGLLLLAWCTCTAIGAAQESLPANAKVVKLEAQPATIELRNAFDYRQVLLTAHLDSGDIIDATRMAQWDVPANVKLSANRLVRPHADGNAALKASLGGQSVSIPVTVTGAKADYPVSYVRDVMPAMSKMGCNQGTCHGAADGKNGFKLSLRGYDPIFDYRSLTDDLDGRRFDRAAPDRSLMLLKPTGEVPHVGGVLCNVGDPYYEIMRLWIAQGVKFDPQTPRVVSITVTPQGPSVPVIGMKQQMAVIAKYADGTIRDVTAEAFIETSNGEVATVDKNGMVTTVRRGEATMLARYEGAYAASTVVVMGDRNGFTWNNPPEYNFIDALVHDKLKKVKVLPSDVCTDAEFIRRVYIDLTGVPPGPDEVRAFLADKRDSRVKRDELVDKLVGSEPFIEHWTNKWADLLQVNRKFLGQQGAEALRKWIRDAIATNMPYDKFAYGILTASGSNVENPPAGYYKVLRDADAAMENTTQLFLAVRFNCNKCHDHPFERWTQDQYFEMAAYFAQVGRAEDPKYKGQKIGGSAVEGAVPLVELISDAKGGEVKHGRTNLVTAPKFPYPHDDLAPNTEPRRVQVAKWITSPKNQYFAKSYVNRVWAYLLGVGMIEPIDDIRAGNPPSNPALLDRLTNEFVSSGFNVQQLMKTICKSRTYQLSIQTNRWNAGDDLNYSHAIARRLPAEVLYDAIHKATGAPTRIPGMAPTARAAQILDSSVELPGAFLDLFGKPVRESACECERSGGMMLGPVLAMVNGPVLADALKDPSNRLAKLIATEKDDGKIVEELFLAVLNRYPTAAEVTAGKQALHNAKADYDQLMADHNQKLAAFQNYEKQVDARQSAWETEMKKQPNWTLLEPTAFKSKAGAEIKKEGDQSLFVSGKNDAFDVYTVTAKTNITGITGVRLELLADDRLPSKGPGRAQNGNVVLNEFKVSAAPANDAKKVAGIALHKAVATFSQESFAVSNAIDGNVGTGWALSPQLGRNHTAVFETTQPLGGPEGTILTFSLDQRYQDKMHTIGRFRLSVTTDKQPRLEEGGLPNRIKELLAIDPAKRTPEQKAELTNYHRNLDGEYNRLRGTLAQAPPTDHRVLGAQDLAWALINNPAFLFNR